VAAEPPQPEEAGRAQQRSGQRRRSSMGKVKVFCTLVWRQSTVEVSRASTTKMIKLYIFATVKVLNQESS
jgi:hypothetical protein